MSRYTVIVKWSTVGKGGSTTRRENVDAETESMASKIALDRVKASNSNNHEKEYSIVKVTKTS